MKASVFCMLNCEMRRTCCDRPHETCDNKGLHDNGALRDQWQTDKKLKVRS